MRSATFELFRAAILTERQVACLYRGHPRELCPAVLGTFEGEERVLAFQFGGSSSRGLAPGGAWRCLALAAVQDPRLRDGPWHEGGGHARDQTCVAEVEIDINVHVRRPRS